MVLYSTYVDYLLPGAVRQPELKLGGVGHSEIIVKTQIAKQFSHSPEYGHDWEFIENIITSGAKYRVALSKECTYHVRSTQDHTKDMID